MTTGRINQVTIVEPAGGSITPRAAGDFSQFGGVEHPAGHLAANRIAGLAPTAIRLPQSNSPERRPPKRAEPNQPHFNMVVPDGGYPSPVTSSERRLPVHERTPECVGGIDGQRPTTHKPQQCGTVDNQRSRLRAPRSSLPKGQTTADGRSPERGKSQRPPRSRQRYGSIGRPGSIIWHCGQGTIVRRGHGASTARRAAQENA